METGLHLVDDEEQKSLDLEQRERVDTKFDKELKNQMDKDPYLNLGFGMVAYFRMLVYLMSIFAFFTLLQIPSIYFYQSYKGLEGLSNYSKAKYSIGNMGFSGPNCVSTYVGLKS